MPARPRRRTYRSRYTGRRVRIVGHSDEWHAEPGGRLVGVLWLFTGLLLYAVATAYAMAAH